jgi:hypothetical protein
MSNWEQLYLWGYCKLCARTLDEEGPKECAKGPGARRALGRVDVREEFEEGEEKYWMKHQIK